MNETIENTPKSDELHLIKEKIIKIDSIFALVCEKSNRISQLEAKCKKLSDENCNLLKQHEESQGIIETVKHDAEKCAENFEKQLLQERMQFEDLQDTLTAQKRQFVELRNKTKVGNKLKLKRIKKIVNNYQYKVQRKQQKEVQTLRKTARLLQKKLKNTKNNVKKLKNNKKDVPVAPIIEEFQQEIAPIEEQDPLVNLEEIFMEMLEIPNLLSPFSEEKVEMNSIQTQTMQSHVTRSTQTKNVPLILPTKQVTHSTQTTETRKEQKIEICTQTNNKTCDEKQTQTLRRENRPPQDNYTANGKITLKKAISFLKNSKVTVTVSNGKLLQYSRMQNHLSNGSQIGNLLYKRLKNYIDNKCVHVNMLNQTNLINKLLNANNLQNERERRSRRIKRRRISENNNNIKKQLVVQSDSESSGYESKVDFFNFSTNRIESNNFLCDTENDNNSCMNDIFSEMITEVNLLPPMDIDTNQLTNKITNQLSNLTSNQSVKPEKLTKNKDPNIKSVKQTAPSVRETIKLMKRKKGLNANALLGDFGDEIKRKLPLDDQEPAKKRKWPVKRPLIEMVDSAIIVKSSNVQKQNDKREKLMKDCEKSFEINDFSIINNPREIVTEKVDFTDKNDIKVKTTNEQDKQIEELNINDEKISSIVDKQLLNTKLSSKETTLDNFSSTDHSEEANNSKSDLSKETLHSKNDLSKETLHSKNDFSKLEDQRIDRKIIETYSMTNMQQPIRKLNKIRSIIVVKSRISPAKNASIEEMSPKPKTVNHLKEGTAPTSENTTESSNSIDECAKRDDQMDTKGDNFIQSIKRKLPSVILQPPVKVRRSLRINNVIKTDSSSLKNSKIVEDKVSLENVSAKEFVPNKDLRTKLVENETKTTENETKTTENETKMVENETKTLKNEDVEDTTPKTIENLTKTPKYETKTMENETKPIKNEVVEEFLNPSPVNLSAIVEELKETSENRENFIWETNIFENMEISEEQIPKPPKNFEDKDDKKNDIQSLNTEQRIIVTRSKSSQENSPVKPTNLWQHSENKPKKKKKPKKKSNTSDFGPVKTTLETIVNSRGHPDVLSENINKLNLLETETLTKYLTQYVLLDKSEHEKPELPFEPFLTVTQKVVLGLIIALEKNNVHPHPDLMNLTMTYVEECILFNDDLDVETSLSLSKFYIALCRTKNVKSRVRVFILDLLYFKINNSYAIIFQIITNWMSLINEKRPEIKCLPYELVLNHIVQSANVTEDSVGPFKNILVHYYRYKEEKPIDELMKELLEMFIGGLSVEHVEQCEYSILVLMKYSTNDWVCKQISSIATYAAACKDKRISVRLISLMGKIKKQLPSEKADSINELGNLLVKKLDHNDAQELSREFFT